MKKSCVFIALLFLSSFQITWAVAQDQSFFNIKQRGELKVCSEAGFVPFEMKTDIGNWSGFDIDLLKAFVKDNNLILNMQDSTLDGIVPALLTKKCDMIASGLTITEERKKVLNFSDPIYSIYVTAATMNTSENKQKYKSFLDIDKKGVRIASQVGNAATLYLKKIIKNAILLQYNSEMDEVNALLNKKVDILVDDDIFIYQYSKSAKIKFHLIASSEKGELAMAFRPNDKQLKEVFDNFLNEIKSKKDGRYQKIANEYFIQK